MNADIFTMLAPVLPPWVQIGLAVLALIGAGRTGSVLTDKGMSSKVLGGGKKLLDLIGLKFGKRED
jgi:hypothetical protein